MSTKIKGSNIEFDFEQIKTGIKNYLSNQTNFLDYDFEGSNLSVLLDILAYNAHMVALTAHLSLNESFLSSAMSRNNIVGIAKNIGYIPYSTSSAKAVVDITITPPAGYTSSTATLLRGTRFSGGGFTWIVTETQVVDKDDATGTFIFEDVEISEGTFKTVSYYYDSRIDYPLFQIPDETVDTRTLNVNVKDSKDSDFYTSYIKFSSFSDINPTSYIYFLQENGLGYYEVYFSNKEMANSPEHGNLIELTYVICNGEKANGVKSFLKDSTILGAGELINISLVSRAAGGAPKETLESIRTNSPLFLAAQDRAVTIQDYVSIIKNNVGGLESVTAWGGENNIPPEYGKVFICVKPYGSESLTDAQKEQIINDVVSPKNVATIIPEIVDPEFTYLKLDVTFKYDVTSTSYNVNQLENLVRNTISSYNTNYLNTFDGVFRHSQLLGLVDNTELSIMNSNIKVRMIKNFTPYNNQTNSVQLNLPGQIFDFDPDDNYISSSNVIINGVRYIFKDYSIVGTTSRRVVKLVEAASTGAEDVVLLSDVGYIDMSTNTIYLYGFRPDTTSEIKIYIKVKSYDIPPRLNQLLAIDLDELTVRGEIDTVKVNGPSGSTIYNPTPIE